jgi:hypothetical protein
MPPFRPAFAPDQAGSPGAGSSGAPRPDAPDEATSSNDEPVTVRLHTDAFDRAVGRLADRHDGRGAFVLLEGGDEETRPRALAALAQPTAAAVHQFACPALLAERRMATQNAIRKAFDTAAEEDAVLCFSNVGALFAWQDADAPDADPDGGAEPTVVEYFFQRVHAAQGLVVVTAHTPDASDQARAHRPAVVVPLGDEAPLDD